MQHIEYLKYVITFLLTLIYPLFLSTYSPTHKYMLNTNTNCQEKQNLLSLSITNTYKLKVLHILLLTSLGYSRGT